MEAQALEVLSSMLLTPQNLGIMIASWFLITVTRKTFPKFYTKPMMLRILPLLPMLLCIGALWLPGLAPKGMEWGWKLILGIVLGWGTGHLHKVLKQTVLGKAAMLEAPKPEEDKPTEEKSEDSQ